MQLLSISEVAKRLAVSRRTAFALATRAGFPTPLRLSARCVRYVEADIERWVEQQRVKG